MICDFAQIYHVLDWRGLPLTLAATLAAGLPEESRCHRRSRGTEVDTNTLLLAQIADAAALLLWRHAKPGTPRPPSFTAILSGDPPPEKPTRFRVFTDGKTFDRELARFVLPQSPPQAAATAPSKGSQKGSD